jgi:hypothetical protein
MSVRIAPGPVEEDMRFQRREWRIKRLAWAVFAIAVFAALCGVFSRGPFSETRAASDDGALVVEYARFERDGAPSRLVVHVPATDGAASVYLDRSFHETFSVDGVEPRPVEARSFDGGVRYVFASETSPAVVRFEVTPGHGGFAESVIADGTRRVSIRQLIYP